MFLLSDFEHIHSDTRCQFLLTGFLFFFSFLYMCWTEKLHVHTKKWFQCSDMNQKQWTRNNLISTCFDGNSRPISVTARRLFKLLLKWIVHSYIFPRPERGARSNGEPIRSKIRGPSEYLSGNNLVYQAWCFLHCGQTSAFARFQILRNILKKFQNR